MIVFVACQTVNIKVPTSQKCDLCSSEHDHDHGGDNVQVKSDSGPGHLYRLRPAIRTSSSLIRHLGPRTQISPAPSPFTPQTFHPARVNSEQIPNYAAAVSVAAIIYPGTIHSALCISPPLSPVYFIYLSAFSCDRLLKWIGEHSQQLLARTSLTSNLPPGDTFTTESKNIWTPKKYM